MRVPLQGYSVFPLYWKRAPEWAEWGFELLPKETVHREKSMYFYIGSQGAKHSLRFAANTHWWLIISSIEDTRRRRSRLRMWPPQSRISINFWYGKTHLNSLELNVGWNLRFGSNHQFFAEFFQKQHKNIFHWGKHTERKKNVFFYGSNQHPTFCSSTNHSKEQRFEKKAKKMVRG